MNNETMMLLDKHFDVAFTAPDGIKKLRELILTLAMQGKLVPQDPNDEPASELLKSIKAAKFVKEGKSKKPLLLPTIEHENLPYQLPKSWEWVRFGHLFKVTSGNSLTKDKMQEGSIPVYGGNGIAGYHDEFNTEKPTIVMGRVGYYCGSIHLTPEKAWITDNAFFTIYDEERLYQNFVIWLLKTINLQVDTSATAQPVISGGKIYPILIPLPPLTEQRRIVAEIDRLMARCDELEKLRADRSQKLLTVHTAALNALLKAKDSSDFSTTWSFITQNFSELYSVKENVAELRKAILQLAVMGKLVPQDLNDEPASELLRSIELEKQRLVKEGKIKKSKSLPDISQKEISGELPKGWGLVRFGDLASEIATGPFGLTIHKSDYIENGVPLINPIHMINGVIVHNSSVSVTAEKASQMDSYRLFEGDIVMARRGEMGRCAIVTRHSNQWLCGTGSFILRFIPNLNRSYIMLLFKSQGVRDYLGGHSVGTTMTNLNHGILNKMPVMLPPIIEQQRIVVEIDRLMGMCDRLEESIEAAKGKQTDLLNALMSQV